MCYAVISPRKVRARSSAWTESLSADAISLFASGRPDTADGAHPIRPTRTGRRGRRLCVPPATALGLGREIRTGRVGREPGYAAGDEATVCNGADRLITGLSDLKPAYGLGHATSRRGRCGTPHIGMGGRNEWVYGHTPRWSAVLRTRWMATTSAAVRRSGGSSSGAFGCSACHCFR